MQSVSCRRWTAANKHSHKEPNESLLQLAADGYTKVKKMPDISKAERVPIALAVADLEAAIDEYTIRLGVAPVTVAGGK